MASIWPGTSGSSALTALGGLVLLALGSTGCGEQRARAASEPAPTEPRSTRVEGGPPFAYPERLARLGFEIDWAVRMPMDAPLRNAYLTGAVLHPGALLIETEENRLISLERSSGVKKWLVQLGDPLDFPPVQTHRRLFCVGNDTLYAIDTRHFRSTIARDLELRPEGRELGVLRWKVPLPFCPCATPASNDEYIAIPAQEHGSVFSIRLTDLDQAFAEIAAGRHGSLESTQVTHAWQHSTRHDVSVPVLVPDATSSEQASIQDLVVYATGEGRVYGRSLKYYENPIRSTAWTFPQEGHAPPPAADRNPRIPLQGSGRSNRIGPVTAPMVAHQGFIYIPSEDHTLYILRQESGYLQGKHTFNGPLSAPPAVIGSSAGDQQIYVHAEGDGFYCIGVDTSDWVRRDRTYFHRYDDPETGQERIQPIVTHKPRWLLSERWRIEGPDRFLMEGVERAYLYETAERTIWAVDKATGEVAWRERATGLDFVLTDTTDPEGYGAAQTEGHVPPFSNRLIVVSREGYVLALKEK
ncbi:MAG: hypothetical protein HY608_02735 [Planctomycetes bacterium]|nr:hypothetical protein [Planctomycetota bacterium]